MHVSSCNTSRSVYLSDPTGALTEQLIVDGILLKVSSPSRRLEVAEIVAQMFDAIEEKNFELDLSARRKDPAHVPRSGPTLVTRAF